MNVQNLPRKMKEVKHAFLPKLDLLLEADYQAIEYRMLAAYLAAIGEPRVANNFRRGIDIHSESARLLYETLGWSYDPENDEIRQRGKTFNFSVVYGGGIPTIMRQTGVDKDTALEMLEAYHASIPEMRKLSWPEPRLAWQKKDWKPGALELALQDRGYLLNWWGMHIKPDEPHKLLNSLCQGGGALLLRTSIGKIHNHLRLNGFKSHIVATVHDSILFDCVGEEAKEVKAIASRLMLDDKMEELCPVETSWSVGVKWSEMEEI